jgi:hypothetical protein
VRIVLREGYMGRRWDGEFVDWLWSTKTWDGETVQLRVGNGILGKGMIYVIYICIAE